MRLFSSYDLVGLQTGSDADHFARFVQEEASALALGYDAFEALGRPVIARSLPIGIDVGEFHRLADGNESRQTEGMLKKQFGHRRLLVGIDRLDYSNGLPTELEGLAGAINGDFGQLDCLPIR